MSPSTAATASVEPCSWESVRKSGDARNVVVMPVSTVIIATGSMMAENGCTWASASSGRLLHTACQDVYLESPAPCQAPVSFSMFWTRMAVINVDSAGAEPGGPPRQAPYKSR